jgi:hypothetical protein
MREYTLAMLLAFVSASFLARMAGAAQENADAKSQIVGSWQALEEDDDIRLRTTIIFRQDETMSGTMSVKAFGSTVDCNFAGSWKLDGKTIEVKVAKADLEPLKDRVLRFKFAVVEKELPLIYVIDANGKLGSVYRKSEKK